MLRKIIDEIEKSIKNECFLAALALALTLPDICGKAEYPTEKCDTKRYISWYNAYVGKFEKPSDPYGTDMPYSSGEIVYNLRCTFLHQGTPNIDVSKVHEERCRVDRFALVITDDYDSGLSMVAYGKGMKIVKREVTVNIKHLCYILCNTASNYFHANKERFNFFDYELIDERNNNLQF